MIEVRGELAGMLLVYGRSSTTSATPSLDVAIATAHQGLGPRARGARASSSGHLIAERGHHRFDDRPGRRRTSARSGRLREARLQAGRRAAALRARRRRRAGTTGCSWTCSPASSCSVRRCHGLGRRRGCSRGSRTTRRRQAPHRAARRTSTGEGCAVDELKQAVAEDRLVLLPVERAARRRHDLQPAPDRRARPGSSSITLRGYRQALGLAAPDPDAEALGTTDLEGGEGHGRDRRGRLLDRGRRSRSRACSGASMARYAEALRALFAQTFLEPGDSELELARRLRRARREELLPLASRAAATHVFLLHLQQLLRNDVLGIAERTSRQGLRHAPRRRSRSPTSSASPSWRETVDVEELGGARRPPLQARGRGRSSQPVRVVKQIGDAVMLVSPDAEARCRARCLALIERADGRGRTSRRCAPASRSARRSTAGATGSARPVNVASRLTGRARPGAVLVSDDGQGARSATTTFAWSDGGREEAQGPQQAAQDLPARRAATDVTVHALRQGPRRASSARATTAR